ncbi:MAG: TonB-dependent receptor [Alphaproteobacteria bacterium]
MKSMLMMGACALALMAAQGAAHAQEAPKPSSTEAQASDTVEKVTVTARKRAEQARDVPGAVTAITSQQKENLVVDGMQDYVRQVPGATLVSSGPEYLNDFSMRGQGGGRLGFSETSTGIFKDGHYAAGGGFGGRSLNRLDLLDLERLEVMRGPQGALYGRNSVGGAVNVITNAPSDIFSIYGKLGWQDTERTGFEGVINTPVLDDVLNLRVAGLIDDQNGGSVLNLTTGNTVDRRSFNGARVALGAEPSQDASVRITFEHYDSKSPGFSSLGYRATAPAGAGGFVIDPDIYTRSFMNREGYADVREDSMYISGQFDAGFANVSLKVNHRARDAARTNEDLDHFNGIAGYTINGQVIDLAAAQTEDFMRSGAELFLSSKGETRLRWLVGVEAQAYEYDVTNNTGGLCPAYAVAGAPVFVAGCNPGGGVTANPDSGPLGVALTATQVGTALSTARQNLNNDAFTEQLKSYSLFGSLDYDLTDDVTLGIEARLQQDNKDYQFQRYTDDPLAYFGPGAVPTGRLAEILVLGQPAQFCPPSISGTPDCVADGGISRDTLRFDEGASWTRLTPAATLKWDINATDTGYARFATGFRPGGYNNTPPNGLPRADLQALIAYDPEYAYSYEVGWKGSLLSIISLDIAAYYSETKDIQVVTAPSAASRGLLLDNAGNAHTWGIEAEARTRFDVGPGRMFLTVSAATQDGQFEPGTSILIDTNGDGVPDVVDLNGKQVPRMRDIQMAASAAYFIPLWEGVSAHLAGSMQTAYGGFENADNSRGFDGYTLYDARLGLATDMWRLSVFGRNLSDETYRLQNVLSNDYYNEPQMFGVELSFRK